MSKTSIKPWLLALTAAVISAGLAGCSTPEPALAHANHSTRLMSLLDVQLKEHRRLQLASQQSQREALAAQREYLDEMQGLTALSAAASKSSGDTQLADMTAKMLGGADLVANTRRVRAASATTYAASFESLLKPLADTGPTLTAAQTKMAAMGVELDRKVRVQELMAFVKDIKKSVEDNEKKIKDAEAAAAKAAATAASAAAGAAKDI